MEGYTTGLCALCFDVIEYVPEYVPTHEGKPVCGPCITSLNPLRTESDDEPIVSVPGTYREILVS